MASLVTESKQIPLFIKREDGLSFKQMKTCEISQILQELESKLGPFEAGGVTIAAGGDLFIRPKSKEQQELLLKVKYVLNGRIMVACTQPKSASRTRVTIHQVPTGDSEEEIYDALRSKGYPILSVYRFKTDRGSGTVPTSTVALDFDGLAPEKILINEIAFTPRPYFPGPPRCAKKCQRLGHTSNNCRDATRCNNCGGIHEDMANCAAPPHCINCSGKHPASSPTCPKFQRMKLSLRATPSEHSRPSVLAQTNSSTYSQILNSPALTSQIKPETEILKGQIAAMQTELAQIRKDLSQYRVLEKKVNNLDLTVSRIQNSLASIETGQKKTNSKIDKLCDLIANLLPSPISEDMEISLPETLSNEDLNAISNNRAIASPNLRMAPAKNSSNKGLDPASKKSRSSLDLHPLSNND